MAVWHKIREEGIEPKHYMRDGAEAASEWFQSHDVSRYINDEF